AWVLSVLAVQAQGSLHSDLDLELDLDRLVASLPPGHVHSIKVVGADSGRVMYERNASYNLLPASTVKAITAIVAYQALGSDYRFSTRLLSHRKFTSRRVLNSDLLLSFSGDPSLTHEDLKTLLLTLRQKGVRELNGNIWLDGEVYDGYPRAGGASWDDHNICFAAPVSAMILDRNCFFGWLNPSNKTGRRARMEYDEPGWLLSVDSQIITRRPEPDEIRGCVQEVWPSSSHEYRLEGCVEPGAGPMRMAFSVSNPERAVRRFVKATLKQNGFLFKGKVLLGKPDKAFPWEVGLHFSEPLPVLLERVLEKSDNLYADSILKTIGHKVNGGKGSFFSGTEAVRAFLREEGVTLERSRLVDGSGLSRYNLASADDFAAVLRVGWDHWKEEAPWLAGRSKKEQWLKTGFMNGVNNMVGYVFLEHREPLLFAVILNGLRPAQPVSDEALKAFHGEIRQFQRAFLKRLSQ
ncbi:MAG: D-alanyl-D-alanine carboxypeptidase/D-alanyl-D-alanine endopeptidase, partial [Endozoicomonas sp.]